MRPAISSDPNLMQEIRQTFADEDGDLSPVRKDVKHEDCDYITIGTITVCEIKVPNISSLSKLR